MTSPARSHHRADLDGLRGVAIALVVIFHIFVGRVSGGVDIFLLLSGYFFMGSQLRYAARPNSTLNPWWPVWRTLRRLIPVLALVLVVVVVAAVTVLPAWVRPDFAQQVSSSILYQQNWELYLQGADYNVASDSVSPLQHLWSMSVQGQFYLLAIALPLILAAINRSLVVRFGGPILIVLTAASFAYAVYLAGENQALNYYSTFSRGWQLTLGAVLAIYGPRLNPPRWLREIAMIVGIIMVVSTGFLFDGAAYFPGPAALYPVGGAVLIILSGGAVTGRALSNPVTRWLGNIAYPFYVWHWPLLIGTTVWLAQPQPSVLIGVIVLAVSLLLADLTHRWVEEPMRQHRARPTRDEHPARRAAAQLRVSPTARARALAGGLVVVLTGGLVLVYPTVQFQRHQVINAELDPATYPGAAALAGAPVPDAEPAPDPLVISEIYPIAGRDGCMAFNDDPADEIVTRHHGRPFSDPCVYGAVDSPTTVYLLGGSHAEHWSSALDIAGREHGFRVIPLLRQGCPFFLDDPSLEYGDDCREWNHHALEHLVAADPDLVISTSTRPQSAEGVGPDVVPSGYPSGWDALEDAGIPFLGLRDNPWGFGAEGQRMDRTECFEQTGNEQQCGAPRGIIYAPEDPASALLAGRPGMYSVDSANWFCTPDFCPAVVGNIYVYRDSNHLSEAYVRTLAAPLGRAVTAVLSDLVTTTG